MAGSVQRQPPGFDLQPSSERVALQTNYITNFDFLNQYLPDTYEKEFERYGNRTISGFLRMVGAEMPTNSDMIKWAEQGRLHTKYTNCTTQLLLVATSTAVTWTVNDTLNPGTGGDGGIAIRVGQTVFHYRQQLPPAVFLTRLWLRLLTTLRGTFDVRLL